MNDLTPFHSSGVELYRASTDAAGICRDIVVKTAVEIQGRKYVPVEGWQAIATAHGCAASARDVERIDGGVRAIGEIRRMSDGVVIAQAEGFVGEDESTWFGGKNKFGKMLPKRDDYAIRAMAQTRAISRAGRAAFAYVVVMMNAGLSTTPAEEVPYGGFDEERAEPRNVTPDKPAKRERQPLLVTAAQTAFTSAETLEAMGAWVEENREAVDALADEHKTMIRQAYAQRKRALTPPADDNPFAESGEV